MHKQTGMIVLAVAAGLALGLGIASFIVSSRPVVVEPSPSSVAATVPTNAMVDANAPKWDGLPQASPSFVHTVIHTSVDNNSGQPVDIPTSKPILFSADFCPWCASTEKLLISQGLMNRVTVVGIDLNGGEPGQVPARTVTNVKQARTAFQLDWKHYGIEYTTKNLLYALPGNALNNVVTSFPVVLIPHAGKWYVQLGYNPSSSFWRQVLS